MLTNRDYDSLPTETDAAFAALVDLLNVQLRAAPDQATWREAASEYVYVVTAFLDECDIESRLGRRVSRNIPDVRETEFGGWFQEFFQIVSYLRARHSFRRHFNSDPKETVALNGQYRNEIHGLLNKVRKVINNLDISEPKREAILQRVADLQAEVDKSRTRLRSLMDAVLEVSGTAGEAAERLKPVVKLMERVTKIFAQARTDETALLLSPPEIREIPNDKSSGSDSSEISEA